MDQKLYKKVIIASANVLFSKGLQKMLIDACQEKIQIVGMPSNLHEMLDQIEQHTPDIVVLDYDDKSLIRKDFLDYFITGQQPLRILLVSLQHTGLVTVYDRHSFTPSKVEDLLSVLL